MAGHVLCPPARLPEPFQRHSKVQVKPTRSALLPFPLGLICNQSGPGTACPLRGSRKRGAAVGAGFLKQERRRVDGRQMPHCSAPRHGGALVSPS